MKEENERRTVAEKQVAEIDDKIAQCKSNISVANDLIDLAQDNIKNDLKIAKVIPIFKSGSKADINNFRPISLLSTFSKIFGKLVHYRL